MPQASHISAFDPVNGTPLPKSMVGFAATLDYVSAGVSQLENVSGTLSGGVLGRGNQSIK